MAYQKSGIAGKNNISTGKRFGNGVLGVFMNALLFLFSISCVFPLFWLFSSSLKTKKEFNKDILSLPANPTLDNYIKVATDPDSHIWISMFNSFRVTLISVILIVLFGFIVGYLISRIRFKGSKILYAAFLLGMLIPIHSLLVPIYIVFRKFNLTNHWYTLIIPYVAFGLPIAIFLIESYIKGIPTELEEAAAIDGSSFTRTLFAIMLPVCKPILATVGIIQTFACWNEFSFALVLLNDVKVKTVPLAMTQFNGQFSSNYPKMMAAMLMTMLPIIIFYFVFSKEIIKGMVSGAVKG